MADRGGQQSAADHDVPGQLRGGDDLLLLQSELDVAGDSLAAFGNLRRRGTDRHTAAVSVPGPVLAAGSLVDPFRLQAPAPPVGPGRAGGLGGHGVHPGVPAGRTVRRPLAVHRPAVVLPGSQPLQRAADDPDRGPGRGIRIVVRDRGDQRLADRVDRTPGGLADPRPMDASAKGRHDGRGRGRAGDPCLRHRPAPAQHAATGPADRGRPDRPAVVGR